VRGPHRLVQTDCVPGALDGRIRRQPQPGPGGMEAARPAAGTRSEDMRKKHRGRRKLGQKKRRARKKRRMRK